jgi:UDP-N-acetylglucosamine:LPS N-acetylglucosamine transferase
MLAGGGGHTGYGYSLAQHLQDKAELQFLVPKGDKLSLSRLSRFGPVHQLMKARGPLTPNAYFIPKIIWAFLESFRFVKRDFDAIISTGSNFCIPPALIGVIFGIPLINIESPVRFTKPGLTTKFLAPLSFITALHWPEQKRILNGVVVGPILPEIEIEPWNGDFILVTGGTFKHKLLFDLLLKTGCKNIVLQTGRISPEKYKEKNPNWNVFQYTENFQKYLAGADVVITHFGSTVLEAAKLKKPMVIVPNPEWTRTVGLEDAKLLARNVNGVLLSHLSSSELENAITIAKGKMPPSLPDGAKKLANLILDL